MREDVLGEGDTGPTSSGQPTEGRLADVLEILERLRAARIRYTLQSTSPNAIVVLVSVPGQYWEIEFLHDGDIRIERYVTRDELLSLRDPENADLIDYLIAVFNSNVSVSDQEATEQQLRSFYGDMFDRAMSVLLKSDLMGLVTGFGEPTARRSYLQVCDVLLQRLRFSRSYRAARRDVFFAYTDLWPDAREIPIEQYDAVTEQIWDAWQKYREGVMERHRR